MHVGNVNQEASIVQGIAKQTMRRYARIAFAVGSWCALATLVLPGSVLGSGQQADRSDSAPTPLFDGTDLDGWHVRGPGHWQVENGQIVGSSHHGKGGWLVLDHGYEDFILTVTFRAAAGEVGVLLRNAPSSWSRYAHPAKQAGEHTAGIYVVLSGTRAGQMSLVSFDGQGKELERKALPPAPPIDLAATYDKNNNNLSVGVCAPEPCEGINDARGPKRGAEYWLSPVQISAASGGWQQAQITLRGAAVPWDTTGVGTILDERSQFGELALHVADGPAAMANIKAISIIDLTKRAAGLARNAAESQSRQLTDLFYSEGVGAGDLNRDGYDDVVAGPFYYTGQDFTVAREIYPPTTFNADRYSHCFQVYVHDFTGDGWPDVLMIMGFGQLTSFSAHLFVNPRGEFRHWDNYDVIPLISSEATQLADIDGDGRPELIFSQRDRMGYAKPQDSDPTKPWVFQPVSASTNWLFHGLGVGDVNGDGRLDILQAQGWWEQPAAGAGSGPWKFHAVQFGAGGSPYGPIGGADMYAYDVNGDGLPDVITSLNAHGPGLAWFEQRRDAQGNITWKRHLIMGDPDTPLAERGDWEETDKSVAFTELHAVALADLNGDGSMDIITGKRWWSHGYEATENDRENPPVLYRFKRVRKPSGAVEWVPQLINNASGIGTQVVAKDINKDGKTEILTSTRKGTFVFFNPGRKE